ncbi:ferredoxin [Nocardia sp. 348MFTsu5.1]|uniref:ferredoxin n=1 Tax=Nocardia sp. 348MFTsu5.1 TaxID=1172185 RepID=UPI0009DBD1B5|nr:ferredoxin [Nocardia sp. 348MFTsu5.1]
MRISVDDKCVGHGQCYAAAPDFLECDNDGFVSIRGISADVPADQTAAARDARDSCPESAIVLSE